MSAALALAVTLPILDALAVALRFFTRRKQGVPLCVDDWLTVPALLFTIAMGADIIAGASSSRSPKTNTNMVNAFEPGLYPCKVEQC